MNPSEKLGNPLPPSSTEAILESISDGVFTVDRNWRITSFNRAAETITGIARQEAVGRRCSDVFRSSMCETECALYHTLQTGEPVFERQVQPAGGRARLLPQRVIPALRKVNQARVVAEIHRLQLGMVLDTQIAQDEAVAKVQKAVGRQLMMTSDLKRPALVSSSGVFYGTIVRDVRWSGKPFPGAKIDGHMVTVPNVGRIFFGELLMSSLELGSPLGGYVGGGDVGSNGSWYP